MTERIERQSLVASTPRNGSVSLGSALFLTVLVTAALSALAFWPSKAWSPPRRPGISAPIVFDEFVNPSSTAPAASSGSTAAP